MPKSSQSKGQYPDHTKELHRINRVRGQLEGIQRMIAARRYCPEILTQTRAVVSALKALEIVILEKHFAHCVRVAIRSGNRREANEKLGELLELFQTRI